MDVTVAWGKVGHRAPALPQSPERQPQSGVRPARTRGKRDRGGANPREGGMQVFVFFGAIVIRKPQNLG